MGGNRLTDKQKKIIMSDYSEHQNYSAVARKHKIAIDTVKRIVLNDDDTRILVENRKAKNTRDMLEYMDSKVDMVQKFIDLAIIELSKPEKLEKARLSEITTAVGTMIDKWTGVKWRNDGSLQKLDQIIDGLTKEADRVNKDAADKETG